MSQAHLVDPNEKTRRNVGIAYVHLAQDYLNKGDLDNAIIAFERADLTGVMSPQLLNDYGFALANVGQINKAISSFEKALELSPYNEVIQGNLNLVRKNITTDLSKEESDIEFASDFRNEEASIRTELLVTVQTPVYTIDWKNLAVA